MSRSKSPTRKLRYSSQVVGSREREKAGRGKEGLGHRKTKEEEVRFSARKESRLKSMCFRGSGKGGMMRRVCTG